MRVAEPTLKERADHLYRWVLLLRRLFTVQGDGDDADWLAAGDAGQNLALCAGIREALDDLAEHARVLTLVPSPLGEWRLGDGANDDRWRALTELERREILSLVSGYESLIAWCESVDARSLPYARVGERGRESVELQSYPSEGRGSQLEAERARVTRFRQEMGFLDRRRETE